MNSKNQLTNIKSEPTDLAKIFDAVMVSVFFLSICWAFFLTDEYLGYHLKNYGMKPRTLEGLRGIITIHFLHGDWKHITQNSMGFLVLNTFLFYFYRQIAFRVFITIMLVAPVFLWLVGRDSNHIGASLLIYGEFAFLMASGIIRNNPPLMRVSLVVITFYGSLVWYLFPIEARISFEGHLCGFAIGVFSAIAWRRSGPQRAPYRFELEPELPDDDDENAFWKTPEQRAEEATKKQKEETTVSVKYHFKEKNQENN